MPDGNAIPAKDLVSRLHNAQCTLACILRALDQTDAVTSEDAVSDVSIALKPLVDEIYAIACAFDDHPAIKA